VNLPPIDRPMTSEQLRDRVLALLNGKARSLSRAERERRIRALERLRELKGGDA
jgi:hypothetical protein